MTLQQALKYFGSEQELREALQISRARLKDWVKAGYLPPLVQNKLENISHGALKADTKGQRI